MSKNFEFYNYSDERSDELEFSKMLRIEMKVMDFFVKEARDALTNHEISLADEMLSFIKEVIKRDMEIIESSL